MKRLLPALLFLVIVCVYSCTKERDDNIKYFRDHAAQALDSSGAVVINEYLASGSTTVNEFGIIGDWIELYNTGDSAIDFAKTNYYITDDSTTPDKFLIDKLSIPGKGHLLVFCDDSAKIVTQIHTGFGLSKSGEFVGLFRKRGGGGFDTLTWRAFGSQVSNVSEGRYPDGGTTWTTFSNPTPGTANQ